MHLRSACRCWITSWSNGCPGCAGMEARRQRRQAPVQTGSALSAGRHHVPAKQGFSIPLAQWFRGPLRENTSAKSWKSMTDSGLFNNDYLGQLLQQHDSGLRTTAWSWGAADVRAERPSPRIPLIAGSPAGRPRAIRFAIRSGWLSAPHIAAARRATGTRGAEHET